MEYMSDLYIPATVKLFQTASRSWRFSLAIKRSSISYANNTRDCSIFYDLFTQLASGLSSGGGRKMRKALFAVDATTISLNKNDYSWAAFRETKAGIKVHVQYKVDDECPTYFFITNAREHENNTMEDMDLKRGDRVAMDRGYFNTAEFHRMSRAGIEFVTRTKSSVLYEVVRELPVTYEYIEADRIIKFTGYKPSKECPDELRLIRSVNPETGKDHRNPLEHEEAFREVHCGALQEKMEGRAVLQGRPGKKSV